MLQIQFGLVPWLGPGRVNAATTTTGYSSYLLCFNPYLAIQQ